MSLNITHYPWDKGGFKPLTQVKLQYSDSHLYVIFRVEDRYVQSLETNYDGMVCRDACVELFFSPNPNKTSAYYNIETNCGGTILMRRQTARNTDTQHIGQEDAELLDIAHSMPKVVKPEIVEPLVWVNEYRVPFTMLEKYGDILKPASGVVWKANFYKCAETNSHPHWGCWSPISTPEPDFHKPEYFGTLEFE